MDAYFKKLSQPFFARAGVRERVDVRIGAALDQIKGMVRDNEQPFDLIFIDADKTGYHDYYETIIGSGLLAKGGVLLVDNTLYKGLPFTPDLDKASPELLGRLQINQEYGTALRKFNQHVAQDQRVEASILPIRDGVTWIVQRQEK
ncbi:caffeoyl-o-methyltransferase [Ceraceosorus bombacis]|uniref:Caffeoyl-o-methyltransferase n=1 Tax=Ceraceosorus bombacis TaxID=401625 RepID=A0A0P1BI41_9BASI|nr:caffeoyl-o-methyltransferase [Ceraceosorus bombacis]